MAPFVADADGSGSGATYTRPLLRSPSTPRLSLAGVGAHPRGREAVLLRGGVAVWVRVRRVRHTGDPAYRAGEEEIESWERTWPAAALAYTTHFGLLFK